MGDRSRSRISRDFTAADGEDDEPLAVRGALRAASAGLRICGADCESGSGVEVVSGATRASDGFRVLGAWFGGSGCAAASELFDSGVWLAACPGNRRACADGSVTSRWNLDYAVNSGTIRAAPGWRIQKQLSRDSDRGHDFGRRARSRRNGEFLADSAGLDISDRRRWIGHPALHLVFERPRLLGDGGITLFHRASDCEPGRKNSCWICGGSRPEEGCDVPFLFFDGSVGAFARDGKATRGSVGVRIRFWIFDGGGLHAYSVGYGRELRNSCSRQTACVDHHGVFAGAMGIPVDCGKAVWREPQL